MRLLNQLVGAVAAALLYPFRGLPPIVGLAFVSLLTSIAILLVFRRTSDQAALRRVKNRIVAGILEIRLFRDDLRLIMRAQRDILRSSFTYFRLSLVPMLWVILPVLLLMIQLQFHYGYRPLEPGQSAILRVSLADGLDSTAASQLMLEASDGVAVATPLLLIPSEAEADWRVLVTESGAHEARLQLEGLVITKSIAVGSASGRISPRRPSGAWFDQLLYPVEAPVPADAPFASIEVDYPAATVNLLGWHTHWMVAFFILTLAFAFALQKPLRVTI